MLSSDTSGICSRSAVDATQRSASWILLSEAMTSAFATRPKRGAHLHQLVVRLGDGELPEVVFEFSTAELAPSSLERAVAKLGDGDE